MIASRRFVGTALALVLFAVSPAQAQEDRFDFRMLDTPKPVPDLSFADLDGTRLTLRDFRGRYVLLNVWATWCPPCRKELPSLDRLQAELGGADFQVVALSTDTGRDAAVLRLYQELDLDETGIFIDATGSAMRELGIFGMPVTLLIDAGGNEVGRKLGPAEWDNPAALSFFRETLMSDQDTDAVPVE